MLRIPTEQDIDAHWFSQMLSAQGQDAVVQDFDAAQIGTGQIGKCVRYKLRYASGEGPASLIIKYPSDDPTSRATGVMLRNFFKEVRFYQQMQQRVNISTPACYFAEIVDEGPEFAVVMADLTPAEQGDQLKGCDVATAEAAVLELVGLHAPSWCQQELKTLDWLGNAEVTDVSALRDMYRAQLPGFLERYGPNLTADECNIISALGEAQSAPLYERDADPFSLVHVDYRLDNLLILPRPDGLPEITVVDWQSITLGAPLNDVAYFMGAGLLPAARRACEEDIVHKYHAALCAAGVEDFSWEDCWTAYRRGVFAGFGVTVVASMLVQQTERGDAMFTAMAQRHARHALDLDGADFLA